MEVLHWSRSVHHPRIFPMPAEGSAIEKSTGSRQHSSGYRVWHVGIGRRGFPQGRSSARNSSTVARAGGRDSGNSHCAAWRLDVV